MKKQNKFEKLRQYNLLSREANGLYRGRGRKYGLPDCALWILYIIRESDKCYTQSELCERLFQPKQTINTALKKLEDEGYLELRYAHNNRKSKQIFLTPAGIALAEKSADKIIEAEQKALSCMTESEQDAFLELFSKYIGYLREELNKIL